jgi:hypothetical protein
MVRRQLSLFLYQPPEYPEHAHKVMPVSDQYDLFLTGLKGSPKRRGFIDNACVLCIGDSNIWHSTRRSSKMLLDAGVDFIGKVLLGSLVETEGGHGVKMI